jgi:hypothetical protein
MSMAMPPKKIGACFISNLGQCFMARRVTTTCQKEKTIRPYSWNTVSSETSKVNISAEIRHSAHKHAADWSHTGFELSSGYRESHIPHKGC